MNRYARLLAAAALLAVPACSGGGDAAPAAPDLPDGPHVSLKLLSFRDGTLSVKTGTTVSWVNEEALPHTVTTGSYTVDPATSLRCQDCAKKDGLIDEELPSRGASTSYTFRTAGTFTYFCSFHRGMNATVTVTA